MPSDDAKQNVNRSTQLNWVYEIFSSWGKFFSSWVGFAPTATARTTGSVGAGRRKHKIGQNAKQEEARFKKHRPKL
jgi:hypothetical protein